MLSTSQHQSASDPTAELTPQVCLKLLLTRAHVWLLPMVICGILATGYALVMSRDWEASQPLVVRDEASIASLKQPGKFADLFEMRTFQETILELAKSRQVLAATLKNVELAQTGRAEGEPTNRDLEKLRKRLSMSPPDGAEFGKTEVFYFRVKDPNKERAILLVEELCRQVANRLQQLRIEKSQSLTADLQQQFDQATRDHELVNRRLIEFETEVGADLSELRILHSAVGGQSDLRQHAVEFENEIRRSETRLHEAEQLLVNLQSARSEPEQLLALPSGLLSFQPTLQRLKDGLVDAQLAASRLSGNRTDEHPHVQAAMEAVEQIRSDLQAELEVGIKSLQVEIALLQNNTEELRTRFGRVQQRLNRLAELRAEYSTRVSAVANAQTVLDQIHKQLSEVQANQAAAKIATLVTPIDRADVGANPVGLGRTMVVLLGAFGGLTLGLGWIFLTIPVAPTPPRSSSPSFNSNFDSHHSAATQPTQSETAVNPDIATPGIWPEPATANGNHHSSDPWYASTMPINM